MYSAISSQCFFPTTLFLLSSSLIYVIVVGLLVSSRASSKRRQHQRTRHRQPNAELSVEVSTIELGMEEDAQEGATGRVMWGFSSSTLLSRRASEVGRAGHLVRSLQADAHTQRTKALHLGGLGTFASTAGNGLVKIWDGAG